MIIVFRENLTVGAVVDPGRGVVELRDEMLRERLDEFSRTMASGPAHLRVTVDDGDMHRVSYRIVGRDSPDYEEALLFELRARGLAAVAVLPESQPLFDLLDTDRFTSEQRNQIISILQNLSHGQIPEFVQDILDVAALGGQLEKVRGEWDAFVRKGI